MKKLIFLLKLFTHRVSTWPLYKCTQFHVAMCYTLKVTLENRQGIIDLGRQNTKMFFPLITSSCLLAKISDISKTFIYILKCGVLIIL